MARLIKAYSDPDEIVFELAVVAASKSTAEARAKANFFIRNPGQLTGLKRTEVLVLGSGVMKEHRVLFYLDPSKDLKSMIRLDKAIRALEEML